MIAQTPTSVYVRSSYSSIYVGTGFSRIALALALAAGAATMWMLRVGAEPPRHQSEAPGPSNTSSSTARRSKAISRATLPIARSRSTCRRATPATRPAATRSCTCCMATADATTPSPHGWPSLHESGDRLAAAQGFSEAIVVTPNAFSLHKGSMYSNSPTTGDWERFIAEDLVAYIDGHYRTLATRMSRGLAGHSMGGYGALRIGMKRPDVFFSLYLMSSCCLTANRNPNPEAMAASEAIKTREQAEEAARGPGFGPSVNLASAAAWSPNPENPPLFLDLPVKDGKVRPDIVAKWVANAPLEMVEQYAASLKKYYAIAIDIGTRTGCSPRTGSCTTR